MKKNVLDFIVIDDDRVNNVLCKQIIKRVAPNTKIATFTYPEEGIAYINSKYALPEANDIVLFLDINMPFLNGWEVLEALKDFPSSAKQHLKIFMLSSFLDLYDKEKVENNSLVSGFKDKPLTILKVLEAIY